MERKVFPTKVITVYQNDKLVYMEAYDVVDKFGELSIENPVPVTEEIIDTLTQNHHILPREEAYILAYRMIVMTSGLLCWYSPPQKRDITLVGYGTAVVDTPGYIFVLNRNTNRLSSYNVKSSKIDHGTILYNSVTPNGSNGVCMGTAKGRTTNNANETIKSWEQAYFGSNFTAHSIHSCFIKNGDKIWHQIIKGEKIPRKLMVKTGRLDEILSTSLRRNL